MTAGDRFPTAPIGLFDSGIGGLSVLRHVRAHLPAEDLVYFSDARFAPYGGLDEAAIRARALAIGATLTARGIKALVVACNTATAMAIAALRARYPELIVIGVEPGLKPAALRSRSGVVGVLATEATLASRKFAALRDDLAAAGAVRFVSRACPGLADAIEAGASDSPATRALLEGFLMPLLAQEADALVLGCTHYPFALPAIVAILRSHGRREVAVIDTGEAVARQLARLLAERGMLRTADVGAGAGVIDGISSGAPARLRQAFRDLLQLDVDVVAG